jgi:hypothetical protein
MPFGSNGRACRAPAVAGAGGLRFGVNTLDNNTIVQRAKFHKFAPMSLSGERRFQAARLSAPRYECSLVLIPF